MQPSAPFNEVSMPKLNPHLTDSSERMLFPSVDITYSKAKSLMQNDARSFKTNTQGTRAVSDASPKLSQTKKINNSIRIANTLWL